MNNDSEVDTVDLPPPGDSPDAVPWPQPDSTRVQVELAARTDVGLVRKNNEDHFLAVRFGRMLETLLTNLPGDDVPARSEEVGYGLVVADGMGGTSAGEIASRMAISTLYDLVIHTPDWVLSTGQVDTDRVIKRMTERFRRINAVLHHHGTDNPALSGMGTTMTLACSLGATLVIGHIGDSRAYLFRDNRLHQLTRDHNLVQSLVDLGCITPEQATKHPYRHALTRYLGSGPRSFDAEFQRAALVDGDQILLCTDGLTEMVDVPTIASILGSSTSADDVCNALISKALEKGGKDNVTVALARYSIP
jgi:protein phosphatase